MYQNYPRNSEQENPLRYGVGTVVEAKTKRVGGLCAPTDMNILTYSGTHLTVSLSAPVARGTLIKHRVRWKACVTSSQRAYR